jgi:peptide/nickel transport system ATP-binding protein
MSELAEIRGLCVSFPFRGGTVRAVRRADLALAAGECLALVGESGSGKSVTARSLIGLAGQRAALSAERIAFGDADLTSLTEAQWRRLRGRRIGYVLQDALTSLDPLRRIRDEVAEPLIVHRLAGADLGAEVLSLLGDAGIPDPASRAGQYPHELSGGLRQRALIASALAARPALLIADEPTASLDVTVQAQVLGLLAAKRDAGTAVLLITHDMAVVARMADRIAVMYAGLIVEEGPAGAVLASPVHPYTADLLAAVPSLSGSAGLVGDVAPLPAPADGPGCPYAPRCSLASSQCLEELPQLTEFGASRVRCWHAGQPSAVIARRPLPSRPLPPPGDVILDARHLTRRFRSLDGPWRTAVDDVSFELRAAQALGIVGESGSGKTTTAHLALGLLAPDGGTVLLDGKPWSGVPERNRRRRRARIGYVTQDTLSSFDPRYSVQRIVAEGLPGRSRFPGHSRRDRVVELLASVGLDAGMLSRRAAQLSGGQRQRVAIARALATEPAVLVCDEPVSALDASVQARILALFAGLRASQGVALLFISHDLGVIRQVCDRVLVMKDGSVVEEGTTDAVFSRPQQPYTQALLEAAAAGHPVTSNLLGKVNPLWQIHGQSCPVTYRHAAARTSTERLPARHEPFSAVTDTRGQASTRSLPRPAYPPAPSTTISRARNSSSPRFCTRPPRRSRTDSSPRSSKAT